MWLHDRASAGAREAGPSVGYGPSEGALASLAGDRLAQRFCAWRGSSEHRYIASIYPLDPASADLGLPSFEHFLLIAVASEGHRRRIVFATAIERDRDRRVAIARARSEGADEWHVHFLAETPMGRQTAARDLERRHLAGEEVVSRVA